MSDKTCFKCGLTKPRSEFYRHKEMADGYLGKCKECTKRDVSTNYRARADQYRAYEAERNKLTERRAARKRFERKMRRAHPEKYRARSKSTRAYRAGKIVKTPCIHCGKPETEMHHRDYSKPLDVVWVCHRCHIQIEHKGNRREAVA